MLKSIHNLLLKNQFLFKKDPKLYAFLKKLLRKDPIFYSLIKNWKEENFPNDKKFFLVKKLFELDRNLPEKLIPYTLNTKKLYHRYLLKKDAFDVDKIKNLSPPHSMVNLKEINQNFKIFEKVGLAHLNEVMIVLIAGGIGERLGYSDIKLKLKTHLFLDFTFIEYYSLMIRSLEKLYEKEFKKKISLPFILMTSENTYEKTQRIFQEKKNFKLKKSQVFIIQQTSVPCFKNLKGEFAFNHNQELLLKPAGHGEIHSLFYQNKILAPFLKKKKYLFFMQDTNIQVANIFLSSLGVLITKKSHFTWIGVIRKAAEKMGLIVQEITEKSEKIYNLEYNLLGDTFHHKKDDFLGNTNMFWLDIKIYQKILKERKGILENFVNPKMSKDKSCFLIANRKESLMQDIVKYFPRMDKVTLLAYNRNFCFSPVKNQVREWIANPKANLYTPLQAEEIDFKTVASMVIKNNKIFQGNKTLRLSSQIKIATQVKIFIHPYGRIQQTTLPMIKKSIFHPGSILILNLPYCTIDQLVLEKNSALILKGDFDVNLMVEKVNIKNRGYEIFPLKKGDYEKEEFNVDEKMYGYRFKWLEPLRITLKSPGNFILRSDLKLEKVG